MSPQGRESSERGERDKESLDYSENTPNALTMVQQRDWLGRGSAKELVGDVNQRRPEMGANARQ